MWVTSLSNFDKANADPLLKAIDRYAQSFFGDMGGMVEDLGAIAAAVLADPDKLVA